MCATGFQYTNSRIDSATEPDLHPKEATARKAAGDKKGWWGERAHGKGESRLLRRRMERKGSWARVSCLVRDWRLRVNPSFPTFYKGLCRFLGPICNCFLMCILGVRILDFMDWWKWLLKGNISTGTGNVSFTCSSSLTAPIHSLHSLCWFSDPRWWFQVNSTPISK